MVASKKCRWFVALPSVLLLVSLWLTSPASAGPFSLFSRKPDGPAIYKQQCAKCHGPAGQGVKGKYNDPLVGDWSGTVREWTPEGQEVRSLTARPRN